jgi:VanZ family protein
VQHRVAGRVLALASLLAVALATLTPSGEPLDQWTFWCLLCGDKGIADTLSNVLLLAPFGAALALLGWRARRACLAGALVSAAIELAQLVIPGRWAALGDIVFNATGALLGWAVITMAPAWLRPAPRRAARLSLVAGLAAAAVFVGTAFLLAPALPRSTYWGQWTPRLESLEPYDGEVLDARIGPLYLPSFRIPESDSARSLLLRGAPLAILALAGPAPPGLASLVSIADDRNRQILLLGPDWDDLVFIYRMRAGALTLSQPTIRLGGWLGGVVPGDTLRVAVRRTGNAFCIELNGRRACRLGFTAGRGWAVINNLEVFPWLRTGPLDALWVALLGAPFGLWARRHPASVVGGLAALVALIATPAATGILLPTPWHEVAGWLAGAAAGSVVGRGPGRRVR